VRFLVSLGAGIFSWAARHDSGIFGSVLLPFARPAFAHFCAGETLKDCVAVSKRLESGACVRCIVDWSVEEREDAGAWDYNSARKAETLQTASNALGESAAFMPVKLTALLSPALLERMTQKTSAGMDHEAMMCDPREGLEISDRELLETALGRLRQLCTVARECRVPLLLDAEQTDRQPAVHALARLLQQEFNVDGQIVIYDTLQMYLKSSEARLEACLAAARDGGYTYAVKLVRGAYIEQEKSGGNVHTSKENTDAAYDAAAAHLLSAIAARETGVGGHSAVRVALLLATHNRQSLERATQEMERLGLARNHHCVHFAQILGMVDNLTNALGIAGYNASKLVVFGEIREVLPWLLRRVQENRDAFGAQAGELHVLRTELLRRLLPMTEKSAP
jgi:hypothetical protein